MFDPDAALRAMESWHTWFYAAIPAVIFGAGLHENLRKELKEHPWKYLSGFVFAMVMPVYLMLFAAPP
jgi:hypothetical protein